MSVYQAGKRIKVYTGKKIEATKWDVKTCRANPKKYKTNVIGFNKFLQTLNDEVVSLINDKQEISKADLRDIVDRAGGLNNSTSFFLFCEQHIAAQLASGSLKPISAKGYRTTVAHLKKVQSTLTFEGIDMLFYDRFVAFLRQAGLASNSIGAHIKRLKWVMAAAFDRDLHKNLSYRKKSFKTLVEESDQIYLTTPEIDQLRKANLKGALKKVADAFVLNCYLGLRFGDLTHIKRENFKVEGVTYYLSIVQNKTSQKVRIPIPDSALVILEAYNFTCPILSSSGKLMSIQKYNKYLKDAAADAKLNALEDIRINGTVTKLAKHSLIVSHTARRSFATNLYLEGVPIQNIMAVTGHKKEETFMTYIRADQFTRSKGLARHYASNVTAKPSITPEIDS